MKVLRLSIKTEKDELAIISDIKKLLNKYGISDDSMEYRIKNWEVRE